MPKKGRGEGRGGEDWAGEGAGREGGRKVYDIRVSPAE